MKPVASITRTNETSSDGADIARLADTIATISKTSALLTPGAAPDGVAHSVPERMCIQVGELGLLVPVEGGREVIALPAVSRLPNTAPWLRGLANVRGRLIPVVDLALAFGIKRHAAHPYVLISDPGDAAMGLLIDSLPHLLNISSSQRLSERPDVPPLLEEAAVAAYRWGERTWIDLDLRLLFDTLAAQIAL